MFAGGGEKPPEVTDVSGQEDEEDAMVPGFSYGSGPSGGGIGSGFGIGGGGAGSGGGGGMNGPSGPRWWPRDEDPLANETTAAAGAGLGSVLPGGLSDGFGYRAPFGADDGMNSDDFIPGLGAAERLGNPAPLLPVGPRQGGPLPPQEDMWSGGSGGGRNEDWGSGGGGGGSGGGGSGGGRRGGGGGYYRGGPRRGRH